MEVTVELTNGKALNLKGLHAILFYDEYTCAVTTKKEHFTVNDRGSTTHFYQSKIVLVTVNRRD